MSNKNSRAILSDLIKSRRTRKPVFFNPQPPSPILIKELIECARVLRITIARNRPGFI